VTPVVADLKRWGDDVARAELEKNRHRFSEADYENIEKLVGSVVRKIIGTPMAHLLDVQADAERTLLKAEFVRTLFNLDGLSQDWEGEGSSADPGTEQGHPRAEEHRNGNAPSNGNGAGSDAANGVAGGRL
jgi:hypothetical protein